jgi:hypothetical protein
MTGGSSVLGIFAGFGVETTGSGAAVVLIFLFSALMLSSVWK